MATWEPTGRRFGKRGLVVSDGAYNMLPSIVRCNNGDVVLAYRKGADHADTKGKIVSRRSSDLGVTWSAEATVVDDATYDARDPNLVLLSDGRVALSYFLYNQGVGIMAGGTKVRYSTDHCVTWGAALTVADGFTGSSAVSAPVVEHSTGLLLPVYGKNTGDANTSCRVCRSTDGGATFAYLAPLYAQNANDCDEPNLAIHTDGRLLAAVRRSTDRKILYALSSDPAVWGSFDLAFDGWGAPRLLTVPSETLCIYRAPRVDQYPMTRGYSAGSWDGPEPLWPLVSEYGAATILPDGSLLIGFCVEVVPNVQSDLRTIALSYT